MTFLAIFAVAFVLVFFGGVALLALCNAADSDKPQQETKPMSEIRVIRTRPGDGLVRGVEMAMRLASEHGAVFLIHQNVGITVSADVPPDVHGRRWRDTAALYSRGEVVQER